VLRDDLLVELCKRKAADERQIAAVRGMQRSDLRHIMRGLCEAIQRGLDCPEGDLPGGERHRPPPPHLAMLGQFMATAVAGLCRQLKLAPALVGTASDMRDLLAWKLGYDVEDGEPLLARTMVVYGSGIRDGNRHDHDHLPLLLFGGGHGFPRGFVDGRQAPLANLHLAVAEVMGARLEAFGDGTGVLRA